MNRQESARRLQLLDTGASGEERAMHLQLRGTVTSDESQGVL